MVHGHDTNDLIFGENRTGLRSCSSDIYLTYIVKRASSWEMMVCHTHPTFNMGMLMFVCVRVCVVSYHHVHMIDSIFYFFYSIIFHLFSTFVLFFPSFSFLTICVTGIASESESVCE